MMTKNWDDVRPYFLSDAPAHVATLQPDGAPHAVPVWVGVEDVKDDADGDAIAFFTETDSRKDRNLRADPRIAFSVTAPGNPLDMASVRGRVVRRIDGDDAWPIIDRIAERYTGGPYGIRSGMVVFLVRPETYVARDYSAGS
jgi:PPOX class probable F420-dependent enzyme